MTGFIAKYLPDGSTVYTSRQSGNSYIIRKLGNEFWSISVEGHSFISNDRSQVIRFIEKKERESI